jgi:hypothetical protein
MGEQSDISCDTKAATGSYAVSVIVYLQQLSHLQTLANDLLLQYVLFVFGFLFVCGGAEVCLVFVYTVVN